MSNIGSSSYYNVGSKASASNGMAGLMSGMDTESMVEKMLSGTQNKLNKQESLKQQTLWKQDIYRDMITSINSFQSKYFDTRFGSTLGNNFASNDFFNSMMSKVTSGNALKVTGTSSSALTNDMKIAVKQLAEQSKLTSTSPVSGDQTLKGTALTADSLEKTFNKQISFTIGTQDVIVDLNEVKTQDEMVAAIQQKIDDAGITGVTAKIHNGKFRIIGDDPSLKIAVDPKKTTDLGLQMTGLSNYTVSPIYGADGVLQSQMIEADAKANADAGLSFDLTLDGVTKTIKLSNVENTGTAGNYQTTAEKVKEALQAEVKKAFGSSINVDIENDKLKFSVNIKKPDGSLETGHELKITGVSANSIGFVPGSSTLVNSSTKLSALGLSGDKFSFKINGKEFTFTGDSTIGNVMNTINTSDAGVKISYSSISDTFKMESSISGSKYGIEISQSEGNLLTKMFGDKIAESGTTSGGFLTVGKITGNDLDAAYVTKSASMKMTVNGKEYTFTLDPKKDGKEHTKAEIETELNSWLKSKFGEDASKNPNIAYKDGEFTIAKGFKVEFKQTSIDLDNPKAVEEAKKTDLALAMGLNTKPTSNIATADINIADVRELDGITLKDASGNVATKLSDIGKVTIDGNDYTAIYKDGRLQLSGSGEINFSSSAQDQKLKELFGNADSIKLGDGTSASGAIEEGKDAIILVNGVETSRNSNSFTIDGVSMELTSKSVVKSDGTYEETVISTSRNTETIVDGFKSFVADYNAMIDKLNGYVQEDADYKKYDPLTAEQKKEMTENEIKLWEDKAKKGLVRKDGTVSDFLAQIRSTLYSTPEGSSLALYQIGIETTTDYNDGGKIQLDENALRTALSADPDAVRNLFTNTTDGIAKQLSTTMDKVAKQSLASPGSLVALAGVKGGSTEKTNTLFDRVTSIESRIKDLKVKYEKEKARYWSQFNNMESVLASFNSQSSMISQQFGGGY